jgi:hypothetical protein
VGFIIFSNQPSQFSSAHFYYHSPYFLLPVPGYLIEVERHKHNLLSSLIVKMSDFI